MKNMRLILALRKRILIQTVLVNSNCQHNIEIKDIVCKYVSTHITIGNYDSCMTMAHERANSFVDMCCGWFWANIMPEYKGMNISYIFNNRHAITRKY